MPRTIQCPQCGVVLNVPDESAGRRLKCPRCSSRIAPEPGGEASTRQGPGVADARPSSSVYVDASASSREFDLPTAEGDLRETFDLPMMTGEAGSPAAAKQSDAVALFNDSGPPTRRQSAAEARARSRRCPTCGSLVPAGMSLCATCGLDLETGTRIGLADDLEPVAPPRRSAGIPIGIALVGGISLLGSIILGMISLFQWQNRGVEGAQLLALVCLFGIFAAVQFLRGKSIKLLVVALSIGALLDVIILIGLPVYEAQQRAAESVIESQNLDPDQTGVTRPITETLEMEKVWWGIAVLLFYAATATYLNSPPVRRHFERRAPF